MPRSWEIRPLTAEDTTRAELLAQRLGCYPAIGRLLLARGIDSVEQAEAFFSPSLDGLHDPFLLEDMELAVARLQRALQQKERILIYGDYDVDGTTAVALLYRYLRQQGMSSDQIHYHIPDRYDEGYGITLDRLSQAHEDGIDLIIAVDTGVKAHEEIAYARSLGMDFIVCDHHTPDDELPPAIALLNPKRHDNRYPFTELSGCGVAFKLLQALQQRQGWSFDTLLPQLELLVLSIAQDRVSLLGENRIFVYHGLRQINSQPSLGLKHLMQLGKIQPGHVDMASIYYELGPRINAAGRMAHGAESVQLLIAEDQRTAETQSQILDSYNRQRQELDQQITRQAIELVEQDPDANGRPVFVLYHPDWNKGVMGIVAARLADRYHRPIIILSRSGDILSGSGRSSGGYDLYQALQACSSELESFGGHIFAAGLTMRPESLPRFRELLESYIQQTTAQTDLNIHQAPPLQLEAELRPSEISRALLRQVERFAPFGTDNERPIFFTRGLRDAGGSRAVGKANQHLSLRITDSYLRLRPIHGFAIGLARYAPAINRHQTFALCYELEENTFYTQSFLQLRVKDMCLESELDERLTDR